MMKKLASRGEFQSKESLLIEEIDILSDLADKKGTSLFLGKYSMAEVLTVLKRGNFLKDAQKRKLWPLDFDLDSTEYPLQRFQVFYQEKKPENLIVDLKIKEGTSHLKNRLGLDFLLPEYNFIILEWLTLQNPLQSFSGENSPLPGQRNPGLSLGKKVLDIFVYLARLAKKDGLLTFPAYFHNALLFSRYFHFFNPEKQGEVQAIRKSFSDVPFKKLAWIVHLNCLREEKNKIYEWKAEEQVYPLNKTLKIYFDSKAYKKKVRESQQDLSFSVDWECYKKKIVNRKA